ncbi:LysR family transcriptional regulator [Deefgea tanakiae]|nr:LysR family transcriptional regulator [Deefgea tanakiae]
MHDPLRQLDLNLLLIFDALYRHGSVAKAANELCISPSAFSHALARLRDSLSDELFVRFGNRMQATIRAEQIAQVVGDALGALSTCLPSTSAFDPATSTQTFVFAATDYTAFALLPMFIAQLQHFAPGLSIKVVYSNGQDSYDDLVAGKVDFVLGFAEEFGSSRDGIGAIECFTDDYVVVVRKDHSTIRSEPSLVQYLSARHVVVTPWNEARGVIDRALEKLGLHRNIAVQLPSLMAAPFIVGSSDLLITLPHRAALALSTAAAVRLFPTPFSAPQNVLKVFFNVKHSKIAGHNWVSKQILQAIHEQKDILEASSLQ